jgi:hypothetical protein
LVEKLRRRRGYEEKLRRKMERVLGRRRRGRGMQAARILDGDDDGDDRHRCLTCAGTGRGSCLLARRHHQPLLLQVARLGVIAHSP